MASVGEIGNEIGWTAWTVWSKQIYDNLEIHFQSNNRMYSKFHFANMLQDKVNMAPSSIPYQLLFPDRHNSNLPFLSSQVKKLGSFTQGKLDVELEEMKYAENAENAEPALWVMEVHKQFGRVLLEVLKVNDYLIIWGGRINPAAKEVFLNAFGSAPCFVTIYRHQFYTPTKLQVQYDHPCRNENVDTIFFKKTIGEDVTIVQRIEPKSTTASKTWKGFKFTEDENDPQAENENISYPEDFGPSCPRVPQFGPMFKKEKHDMTPNINVARRGNSRARRTAVDHDSDAMNNVVEWLRAIEAGCIVEDNNEDEDVKVESESENPEPEVMEFGERQNDEG